MDQKYKGEKRVFEKRKQRLYENGKEIYSIFQDKSFGKKEAPAGSRRAKKQGFEKHKQGGHEKGLGQRDEKKSHSRSFQVMAGHLLHPKGMVWLHHRHLLYPKSMAAAQSLSALPRAHPS